MPTTVPADATWVNTSSGSPSYDAGELRRADSALLLGDGTALGVRSGVVRHGENTMAVAVDGSDVVTVQPGAVVINGNAVGVGPYRFGFGQVANLGALTARNSTNPRIDLVIARALDTDVQASPAGRTGQLEIITGTAAASPAVPSLQTMCIELARLTVPPVGGGAVTVSQAQRPYTVAAGGVLPVGTSSLLPSAVPKWTRAVALDTGTFYTFNGTAWIKDGAWQSYTPSWTTTGTAPTLGNGSLTGRFCRNGDSIEGTLALTLGSTTNAGSGAWFFSLPAAPAAPTSTPIGHLYMEDPGVAGYLGLGQVASSSRILPIYQTTGGVSASLQASVPFGWANGDFLRMSFRYEAA